MLAAFHKQVSNILSASFPVTYSSRRCDRRRRPRTFFLALQMAFRSSRYLLISANISMLLSTSPMLRSDDLGVFCRHSCD